MTRGWLRGLGRVAGRRRRGGFTLVELLIAVGLSSILLGVVVFTWLQSNRIFTTTLTRLETYQRLRTVLDVMERDLANTNRTVDMEFYIDDNDNGHYDDSDKLIEAGAPAAPQAATGPPAFRAPTDPTDPLRGGDEFLETGWAGNPLRTERFFFAPLIVSPPPYEIGAGYTDNRHYWRDEIYVRTYAMVDGANRSALIHYRLVQRADGRSALRRRIWYLNENGALVSPSQATATSPATDRVQLLTDGIADLKVGFFFKESTIEGVGRWFHVGDVDSIFPAPPEDGQSVLVQDEQRGFVPARHATAGLSSKHRDQFGGANAVSFFYGGSAKIEQAEAGPPLLRTIDDMAVAAGAGTGYEHFDFPGVRPGDQVFVYGAEDDDGNQATGASKAAGVFFPDQILTVDQIVSNRANDKDYISIKFREQISFFRLRHHWLGQETPVEVSGTDEAGPARKIEAAFNVNYRVGFLPSAFVVRLSSDDRYNHKILPMERVIRLLQQ